MNIRLNLHTLILFLFFAMQPVRAITTPLPDISEEQDARSYVNQIRQSVQRGEKERLITLGNEVVRRFGESPDPLLRDAVVIALHGQAFAMRQLNQTDEALRTYQEIDRRYGTDTPPGIRLHVGEALIEVSWILAAQGKFDAALSNCNEIDRRFSLATEDPIRALVVRSLAIKGMLLARQVKHRAEISIYEEIDRRYANETGPIFRDVVAAALLEKALKQTKIGQSDAARTSLDILIQRYSGDSNPALVELVAKAKLAKIEQLTNTDQINLAVKAFEAEYSQAKAPPIQELLRSARAIRDMAASNASGSRHAITAMKEMDRLVGHDSSPTLRALAARNLINKARNFGEIGQTGEEIATYNEVARRFADDTNPIVRVQIVRALTAKTIRLNLMERWRETDACVDDILKHFGQDPEKETRRQVSLALNERATSRILRAKQQWAQEFLRQEFLESAINDLQLAQRLRAPSPLVEIEANLAYALFLAGNPDAAKPSLQTTLGIIDIYQFRQKHGLAAKKRIEPEDSAYEQLADSIWSNSHLKH